jgi:hypothetical protein
MRRNRLCAAGGKITFMDVNRMSRRAIFMIAKDFPLISGKSFAKRKTFAIRKAPASSGTGTSGTRGNSPQPAARK